VSGALQVSFGAYLFKLGDALPAAVLMGGGVYGLVRLLRSTGDVTTLVLAVLAGAVTYPLLLYVTDREGWEEFVALVSELVGILALRQGSQVASNETHASKAAGGLD
jgi:hypothetical protein